MSKAPRNPKFGDGERSGLLNFGGCFQYDCSTVAVLFFELIRAQSDFRSITAGTPELILRESLGGCAHAPLRHCGTVTWVFTFSNGLTMAVKLSSPSAESIGIPLRAKDPGIKLIN